MIHIIKTVLLLIIIAYTSGVAYSQRAAYPRVISYTGVLADSLGRPLSGRKIVEFSLIDKKGVRHPSNWKQNEPFLLNGGMFSTRLGDTSHDKNTTPLPDIDGVYDLSIVITGEKGDVTTLPPIAFSASPYSLYALEIPDSTVTNSKIKDGEVLRAKLAPGTQDGQVMKWNASNSKWELQPDDGLRTVAVSSSISGDSTPGNPLTANIPSGVPVGTIVAFWGHKDMLPYDWLLCDGDTFDAQLYPDLSKQLTTMGLSNTTLPDLRGVFLRGSDFSPRGIANIDPEYNNRSGLGVKIGSKQGDEIRGHVHNLQIDVGGAHTHDLLLTARTQDGSGGVTGGDVKDGLDGTSANSIQSKGSNHSHTGRALSSGGLETRPVNVYVNYIIKARL